MELAKSDVFQTRKIRCGLSRYYTSVTDSDTDDHCMILPSEVEDLILARFPRSDYWKLSFLNSRFRRLLKTGELFAIRRELGVEEHSVIMQASGDSAWWAFDREFSACRKLPELEDRDPCFRYGEKQTVCAGTSFLVMGWGVEGHVIWRYDIVLNRWEKGLGMVNPRSLFASALVDTFAYVAGGVDELNSQVYDTAERYNPVKGVWEELPRMNKRRKLCAGLHMDGRFYVIGGRNNDQGQLYCGEYFDEDNMRWELIPDMMKESSVKTGLGPPLLAVANNELYSLEACTNKLKVYNKGTNTWRELGEVPVRADTHKGRGVAFKSLGDELFVMGPSRSCSSSSMAVYICRPNPSAEMQQWGGVESGKSWFSNFVSSCSVMIA